MINIDRPIYDTMEMFRVYFSNDYLFAAIVLLAFLVFGYILSIIYKYVFLLISKRTDTDIDDIIVKKARNPILSFVVIIGIKALIAALELYGSTIDNIGKMLDSVLILIFAYLIIIIFDTLVQGTKSKWKKRTHSKYGDTILPIVEKVAFIFLLVIAVIAVLDVWGIEIAPFLAGLGIAGLAVGLAVQDSLKDFVGGINLILDNTYKVGDKVKLDSGETGKIYSISIRSTRIKTYDNNVIIIPNHVMADSKIINYAQPMSLERGEVPFGVIYGSNVEKTKEIALKAVMGIDTIIDDPPPSVEFLELADFSLNFRALFWLKNYEDKWDTERLVVQRIYDNLNKEGIEFAFPTRTIHISDDEEKP